jgi:hypothetical protein
MQWSDPKVKEAMKLFAKMQDYLNPAGGLAMLRSPNFDRKPGRPVNAIAGERLICQQTRVQAGRGACPSVVIMDSQSVKTAERGGVRGFDAQNVSKAASAIFW